MLTRSPGVCAGDKHLKLQHITSKVVRGRRKAFEPGTTEGESAALVEDTAEEREEPDGYCCPEIDPLHKSQSGKLRESRRE